MADPTLLVDSDVLIDFFRGSLQAADWLSANEGEVIGVPVIVLMDARQPYKRSAPATA